MVLGAGHDVERDRPAVAPAERDDLLGVDLEQARRGDRPDRERSLRPFEAQPRARAAGHEDDADLARGQRVGPDPAGAGASAPARRRSGAAGRPRSAGPARRAGPSPARPCTSSAISRSSCSKSIARDLGRQPRSLVRRPAPPTTAGGVSVHADSGARRGPGRETSRAKLLGTERAARDPTRAHADSTQNSS